MELFGIVTVGKDRPIELWCNGNTADFGSAVSGSSPDSSTRLGICVINAWTLLNKDKKRIFVANT